MVRGLFQIYDRFDVNCADERGYTHFQTACMYGFAGAVKKFLELGQDPDCLVTRTGDSPLHLALYHEHKSVTELLLRAGADPNSVDLFGSSPLHNICEIGYDNHELLDTFFAICDEKGQTLRVDARDESGRTPLHFAVQNGCREMFELLLRRGANPNLADAEGLTPLHIISMRSRDDDLTEMFFELNDELNQRVRVDVWNKKGWTPLQSALRRGNKKTAEILLRRGADANLANEDGLTPLHVICQTYVYDDLAKIFFDICDELNQVIQVDAKDKSGCTPLDLAVVNLMPNTIDVLLDHGADLSGFVFSSSSHFDKSFVVESTDWLPRGKLRLAFGLMLVVERLENRGYKLDRGDVLTIMKTFAKNELFEMSAGVVKNWYDDKETKRQAKEAMVNSSLSLYDLIQLRPEEATKLPTYEDCLKLANTINWWDFPESHWKVCGKHLVEKICRGFFRRWSMDPFMKLTNDSLPHLPCEMIMKNLENEDLYHICAAAAGEIRDVHKPIVRYVKKCETMGNDVNCFKKSKTYHSPEELELLPRFGRICKALKVCRRKSESKIGRELPSLLDQLDTLIREWRGRLPDLRRFFERSDIDWLLKQTIINATTNSLYSREKRIVKFVADTGYKDRPGLDERGARILPRATPIHCAHNRSGTSVICDLFRIYDRYDVNYIDEYELTHFHLACEHGCTDAVRKFLRRGHDPNLLAPGTRDTPLHLALMGRGHARIAELLLRGGADPNSARNRNKWTPLHYICHYAYNQSELIEAFFAVNDELNLLVKVDARDKRGRTPLHLALPRGCKKTVETLLRRGADANLADEDGSTPLHVICRKYLDDDMAKVFFDVNDELNQVIEVNAKDDSGRTPLRLAVANLKPNTVDVLMDGRANLSRFIFPNESDFDDCFEIHVKGGQLEHKLKLASGLMAVVERLEKREYELDRCEALTIMKLFSKYGLFEKTMNLAKCWYDDEEFATEAKEAMVNSSLSLYDLIQLRPEEAAKLLTYEDCYKFSYANKMWKLNKIYRKAYETHLSEKISRRFFWRWAMDPFMELINYRLPHLPSDYYDLGWTTRIDTRDRRGRTPLQSAVAKLKTNAVDVLLDRGADLSSFAFPHEADLDECLELYMKIRIEFKLVLATVGRRTFEEKRIRAASKRGLRHVRSEENDDLSAQRNEMDRSGSRDGRRLELGQRSGPTNHRLRGSHRLQGPAGRRRARRGGQTAGASRHTGASSQTTRPDDGMVSELFKIFDRFDVNYVDESGLTHFHVACEFGCLDVVEKFLELGRVDPNCPATTRKSSIDSPLHLALANRHKDVARLLLRAGADPNAIDAKGLAPLAIICRKEDDDDSMDTFFETLNEIQQQVQIDARDCFGRTLLQSAVANGFKRVTRSLLRHGADPNLTNRNGEAPLHVVCQYHDQDWAEMFFEKRDAGDQCRARVNVRDREFRTPLHLALGCNEKIADALLRNGADPSTPSRDGSTPLHVICNRDADDDDDDGGLARIFFEINDAIGQQVEVDFMDKLGNTPLILALRSGHQRETIELLLRRGADPNFRNDRGLTPLHVACESDYDDEFVTTFLGIGRELGKPVKVDARDKKGRTPLHLALGLRWKHRIVRVLLDSGADPNSRDNDGTTPLHRICDENYDDVTAQTFLEINDGRDEKVEINARDGKGRTPLELAVTHLLPNTVDVLLGRGADVSSFVFPSESRLSEGFKLYENSFSLKLLSAVLRIVERLEDRGYVLDRSDALTIVKLMAKHGLIVDQSEDVAYCWRDDEEFATKAREITIVPSVSLYDLTRLTPREAIKVVKYADYFNFAHTMECWVLSRGPHRACLAHLCETMSREFLRRWALEFFMELTHCRLPLICCDMIIDESFTNKDLLNICLASSNIVH
ncbi:unnamed protein product [Trichogramma brassicae]|uniref:Uncharacterized protein n=1 Tax=Trichogramma brassicae TaxID=86971 RepID=A0A6H5IZD3_9HYME|nr:unnamed protein product [Trichogramma brassicae]